MQRVWAHSAVVAAVVAAAAVAAMYVRDTQVHDDCSELLWIEYMHLLGYHNETPARGVRILMRCVEA